MEEFLAELAPKPDVPAIMRKLSERREETKPVERAELGLDRVTFLHSPDPAPTPTSPPSQRPVVQPLAPARYKVQFTASVELHEKLNRLQALMRSSVLDRDLAAIIEEAVTEKLERLEAKRFAKSKSPRKTVDRADTRPKSRYIPAPVRLAVRERDGNQCTYVSEGGKRCTARDRLEFHHDDPFGRGGGHSPKNIRLVCRAHNIYYAERDYAGEVMERYRRSGSRVSEPLPAYNIGLPSRNATRSIRLSSGGLKWPAVALPTTPCGLRRTSRAMAGNLRSRVGLPAVRLPPSLKVRRTGRQSYGRQVARQRMARQPKLGWCYTFASVGLGLVAAPFF